MIYFVSRHRVDMLGGLKAYTFAHIKPDGSGRNETFFTTKVGRVFRTADMKPVPKLLQSALSEVVSRV